MAKPIDVVRKILELVKSGRLNEDICEGMLDGLELTTSAGTGVYQKGMLKVGDSMVTLNLGTLSAAGKIVWTEKPFKAVKKTEESGLL